ncbi:hypothetical protein [Saccharothrix sp. Mg75]|uniref:hypothetical protein n=1 Tax=Saccharothrix sp. Mg75 TaxID=3445357 RepID=UPI003EEE8D95
MAEFPRDRLGPARWEEPSGAGRGAPDTRENFFTAPGPVLSAPLFAGGVLPDGGVEAGVPHDAAAGRRAAAFAFVAFVAGFGSDFAAS